LLSVQKARNNQALTQARPIDALPLTSMDKQFKLHSTDYLVGGDHKICRKYFSLMLVKMSIDVRVQ